MPSDTIAAIATAPGIAAVALVRLSGSDAFRVAGAIAERFDAARAREARLLVVHDATGPIDRALVTAFPAPRSFTGEDLVELSCHGGTFTAARLLAACLAAGAREAHPGEFTRRAVLHGKLDLLQAEATGDLLTATAPAQADQALRQLDGNLSRRIAALREGVLQAEALLAYAIDFPEEDDGPLPAGRVEAALVEVQHQLEALLATAADGARVRNGALVVLAGPPNAGKSSLFNALLGYDRAIVAELPGTTRDAIEAEVTMGGHAVRLVDTAGLRPEGDPIEAMGIERSHRWLAGADLVVACMAPDTETSEPSFTSRGPVLLVSTKSDLGQPASPLALAVSAVTGVGVPELRTAIASTLFGAGMAAAAGTSEPLLTRVRHRESVAAGLVHLQAANHELRSGEVVLGAAALRDAAEALAGLLGARDGEEVLDRVFAGFCVGK